MDAASARFDVDGLGPGQRDLGEVHHDDLGAGVLDQLGGGGTHAGGAADDQDPLAVVAECVEQASCQSSPGSMVCDGGQATTPRTLRSTMASQSRPSSARMASPCSLNSGARPGPPAPRRTGPVRPPAGTGVPAAVWHVLHVAVGDRLRVGRRLERVLHDRPLPDEVGEPLAPLVEGGRREHLGQDLDGLGAVGHERRVVGEARVGRPARAGRSASHSWGQYLPACRQVKARTRPSLVS